MKTNNFDKDDGISYINGPVSTIAIAWFFICGGFIIWLLVSVFNSQ